MEPTAWEAHASENHLLLPEGGAAGEEGHERTSLENNDAKTHEHHLLRRGHAGEADTFRSSLHALRQARLLPGM